MQRRESYSLHWWNNKAYAALQLRHQLRDCADRIKDYESTVNKYRTRTQELLEEIQDLKDQLQIVQQRRDTRAADGDDASDDPLIGALGIDGARKLHSEVCI